jgi:peptidylprolyl isomerase
MHGRPLALASLIVFAAAGCNQSSEPSSPDLKKTQNAATTGSSTTGDSTANSPTPASNPAGDTGLSKLKIEDVKPGKGPAAANGDTLWVLYTGRIKNGTGKVFDSTTSRDDTPFAVTVGGGQVIQGWDQGLVGMKVGGERNLTIPYKLAYGDNGQGDTIPPKTDLFFNIQAVAMVKRGEENLVDIAVKKAGHGPNAKQGDKVTVSYVGKLPNGKEFDRSKGDGLTFPVGRPDASGARALPGIDEAVQHMNQGEEAIVTIPPKLGKPTGGQGIPVNSVLVFDLTLKKIG